MAAVPAAPPAQAAPRGVFGRLLFSTFTQFRVPDDAGPLFADAYDTARAGSLNGHLTNLSAIKTVTVPMNLAEGSQAALFNLFGRYQLDPIGPSVTHPQSDTFRRLATEYVFDQVGPENIIEIGPSLSRMARHPRLCASHSCSPTIDARDRARAISAAHTIAATHPHAAELRDRANNRFPNPAWMCGNMGQDCDVQGNVILAMFSLQDSVPSDLVDIMRKHGASLAFVGLSLPVALDFATVFYDADTGHRWVRDGDTATCFPGTGSAGYKHSLSTLRAWTSGFDAPLFVEVVYQFGCDFLFKIVLNDDRPSGDYPLLIESTLAKYTVIKGNSPSCPDFLTSASQYDRLLSFLTISHGRSDSLFKAALDRIAVLTPAIVLGTQKHTDRWDLTAEERLAVALAACTDVQRTLHLSNVAQQKLDVVNGQMATAAKRELAKLEPSLLGKVTATLRGEASVSSSYGMFDVLADVIDGGRSAADLHSTGALPPLTIVKNGVSGRAEPSVGDPVPRDPAANLPPPLRRNPPPERNGYAGAQAWHPVHDEAWLAALPALPAARDARLLNNFDPQVNLNNAAMALAAQPVSNLTLLQRNALDGWHYSVDTRIDLLLVGPGGTGKSTQARRIAPEGTVVIVPTNELAAQWTAAYQGHVVLTADRAAADLRLLRTAPCIIMDEIYQMPAGHVVTFCSLRVPTIALGCPAQRRYNGILGVGGSHDNIPVDHAVLMATIHRYGGDITRIINGRTAAVYAREFNTAPNFAFVCANQARTCLTRVLAQRPGLHLTPHVANTTVFPGTMTIDASQGSQAPHVYVHLFDQDVPYFRLNPYAMDLALTRCQDTVTITVPANAGRGLLQFLQQQRLPYAHRQNNVFGAWQDLDGSHTITDFHDADPEQPGYHPDATASNTAPTDQLSQEGPETGDYLPWPMPSDLHVAINELHPFAPNPADIQPERTLVLREPDPLVHASMPEFVRVDRFFEPTVFPHLGYPFSNRELVASVFAIFDRYTKPQNRKVPFKTAALHADIMFDNWRKAFIRTDVAVAMPPVASLATKWFSARTAKSIIDITIAMENADTAQLTKAFYFLKAQGKPKFGKYGHALECGQGILASDKTLNAASCPLVTAATKTLQLLLKANVIYDSGYTADELDRAVMATGVRSTSGCLSIDLSQQDSSHIITHRLFIAKVMDFLGFGEGVISVYLLWREKRTVVGQATKLMFTVFERLFSGEPGTALFNFLMSTGTTASSHDLSKMRLFVGKGDDNTVVPPPRRMVSAFNVIRETGVIQKCSKLTYLDFANRIFTSSGRSFPDPARLVSKYTLRLTKRENTEAELTAYIDQNFTPDEAQFHEIMWAVAEKHDISLLAANTFVRAATALGCEENYFHHLRPSKRPVRAMPTIRHCCGKAIVFEDRRDQCAIEAIAFIADVDSADVHAALTAIRATEPIHPDVRNADLSSKFTNARHVSSSELRELCRRFSVSTKRATAGLSLHVCRGHVSVVTGLARRWDEGDVLGSYRLFGQRLKWMPSAPLSQRSHVVLVLMLLATGFGFLAYHRLALALFVVLLLLATVAVFLAAAWLYRFRPQPTHPEPAPKHVRHYGHYNQPDVGPVFSNKVAITCARLGALAFLLYCLYDGRSAVSLVVFTIRELGLDDPLLAVQYAIRLAAVYWGIFTLLRFTVLSPVIAIGLSRGWPTFTWRRRLWSLLGYGIYSIVFPASGLYGLGAALLCHAYTTKGARILSFLTALGRDLTLHMIALGLLVRNLRNILPEIFSTGMHAAYPTGRDSALGQAFLDANPGLEKCFRTRVTRKGKRSRDFWRHCHPDKLVRTLKRACVSALETQLGRGRALAPLEVPIQCYTAHAVTPAKASKVAATAIKQIVTATTTVLTSTCAWAYTHTTSAQEAATTRASTTTASIKTIVATTSGPSEALSIVATTAVVGATITIASVALVWMLWFYAPTPRQGPPADESELVVRSPTLLSFPRYRPEMLPVFVRVLVAPTNYVRGDLFWFYGMPTATILRLVRRRSAQPRIAAVEIQLPARAPRRWGDSETSGSITPLDSEDDYHTPPDGLTPAHIATPYRAPAYFTAEQRSVYDALFTFLATPGLTTERFDGLPDFDYSVWPANLAPSQMYFYRTLRNRIAGHHSRRPDVFIQGIAGCAKSTIYLELARHANILVVVPTNELLNDLARRAATMGVWLNARTQHAVFEEPEVEKYDMLLIDEAFTLPAYHVYAICALNPRSVAVGDPYQLTDMAIGAEHTFPLVIDSPVVLELPTSFTVPQDIMAFGHSAGLIPAHWRSLSTVQTSIEKYFPGDVLDNYPMVTGSRECAVGGAITIERNRTIFTSQGQRADHIIFHACERDHGSIDSGGVLKQRQGLIWTAMTRHTEGIHLDLCQRFVLNTELRQLYTADELARLVDRT